MNRAEKALRLEDMILQHLDMELRPRCQLVTIRDNTLVLQTESAAWATRLRFQQGALLQQLQQIPVLSKLTKILVKVRPQAKIAKPPQRAKPISADNAEHVKAVAEGLGDDELSRALKRLAERGSK